MMKLILYEFEKILNRRLFLMITLLAAGMLLYRTYDECQRRAWVDREIYDDLKKACRDLPYEEAAEKLRRDADGIGLILLRKGLSESGMSEEEIREISAETAEKYGLSYEEFLKEYSSYEEDLAGTRKVSQAINILSGQYQYVSVYRDFIQGFDKRAEELKIISVFSGEDSFSYRSIEKSLRDFKKVSDTVIMPDIEEGVLIVVENDETILFLAVLLLIAAAILFGEEAESGKLKLIQATKNGIVPLGLAKWISLFLFGALITVIVYGGKLIIAGNILGFGEMSRSIQSISAFRNCADRLSVGETLAFSIAGPLFIMLVFTAFAALLFGVFKKVWLSSGCFTGILLLQRVFYSRISDDAALNALKFLKPFALADLEGRLTFYANVNLFGYPFSVVSTAVLTLLLLSGLFLLLYLSAFSGRIKVRIPSVSIGRYIRLPQTVSLFLQENYRLYLIFLGILAAAAFIFIADNRTEKEELRLNAETYYYYAYGQEISGQELGDTEEWSAKKRQELYEEQGRIGRQDGAEYMLREMELKFKALSRIENEIRILAVPKEKGIPVHYLSEVITDPVFKETQSTLLYGWLFLVLVLTAACRIFSDDYETGMRTLVTTTPRGGRTLLISRYLAVLTLYLAGFILYLVPLFSNWFRIYGMKDTGAPLQSIISLASSELRLSIKGFMILWVVESFFSGLAMLLLGFVLAAFIRKNSTAMVAGIVLLTMDFLVSGLNVPLLSRIVLSSGFNLILLAQKESRAAVMVLICVKNILLTAGLYGLHRKRFIITERKNHR